MVGASYLSDNATMSGFLYSHGKMTDIGSLPAATITVARAINDRGQIVGSSGLHAFFYDKGSMTDLGTFGGTSSGAAAINNRGQAVGSANLPGDTSTHAFLYSGGKLTDLGVLGAGIVSQAEGINDRGQIVGESTTSCYRCEGNELRAFLFDGRTMIDLNDLLPAGSGWQLSFAFGINNKGEIVGQGAHNGQSHAFLMSPH